MRTVLVVLTALDALLLAAACGPDTYCQSGPKNGTQCYSGMEVRQRDPLAPVAPMPPTNHGGPTQWFSGSSSSSRDAAAPEMLGLPTTGTTPRDAGPADASDAAPDAR